MEASQRANLLWEQIKEKLQESQAEIMASIKTKDGETQSAGKNMERFVETVLETLGATFKKAGTQQSRDFRNVGGTGLNIEVKKTDNTTVFFNDTCPTQSNSQRSTHEGRENGRGVSPGRQRPGGRPASPRRAAAGTPPAAPAHKATLSTLPCATELATALRHDRSVPAVAPTSDRPAAAGTPPRSARSHTCDQTENDL